MQLGRIAMGLGTRDPGRLVDSLQQRRLWGEMSLPRRVIVEGGEVPVSTDWRERHVGRRMSAFFGSDSRHYLMIFDRVVKAAFDFDGGPEDVVALLEELPFDIASFESLHGWFIGDPRYRGVPSFGDNHYPHGWACAFRGDGHRRLVSRRWLDQGPWRLLGGSNDVTLVQFHELGLDTATALAQARPAHEQMGISDVGGFLQEPYVHQDDLKGLYDEQRHVLKIVVLGRTVAPREMLDACAARRDNVLGPERPIDNVAYIFVDPAEAHAHLPRLWPYELECWTIVDGVETRLDTPEPPEGLSEPA